MAEHQNTYPKTDVNALCKHSQKLIEAYHMALETENPSMLSNALEKIRKQTRLIRHLLPYHCQLSDVPALLEAYDYLHRISHNQPDLEFDTNVRLSAFDRWLAGDKSISATQATLMIYPIISRNPNKLSDRYLTFFFSTEQTWVEELLQTGHFSNISDQEARLRINHLLQIDLHAFIPGGQEAHRTIKRHWAEYYMQSHR